MILEEILGPWTPEIPFESLTETGAENERKASLEEELDNLMDISIEIASNKRMKRDFIHPFKLTFRDKDIERKYSQQNDYMYKLHVQIFSVLHRWSLDFCYSQRISSDPDTPFLDRAPPFRKSLKQCFFTHQLRTELHPCVHPPFPLHPHLRLPFTNRRVFQVDALQSSSNLSQVPS